MKPITPEVRKVRLSIDSADYKRMILLAKKAPEGAAVYFSTLINTTDSIIDITLNNMRVPAQKVCRKRQLPTISADEKDTVFLLDSPDVFRQKIGPFKLRTQLLLKGTKYNIELTDIASGLVYETTDIELDIVKSDKKYTTDVYIKDLESIVDATPKPKVPAITPWARNTGKKTTIQEDYQTSFFEIGDYDF